MNIYRTSKAELKACNRSRIFRVIWKDGPISRTEIADKLNATRSAITSITNEMLKQRLLVEYGKEPSGSYRDGHKGRRKMLLDIDLSTYFLMGVYIDSENMSVGLTTVRGELLEKANFKISSKTSLDDIVHTLRTVADDILEHNNMREEQLAVIGVGVMPEMFERMGAEPTECQTDFSVLKSVLASSFASEIFVENAVLLLALPRMNGVERNDFQLNRAIIYSGETEYQLAVIREDHLYSDNLFETRTIDSVCVRTGGIPLNGYGRGSVKAELSAEAIGRKAAWVYGERSTPMLYSLTDGDGGRITLAQIMTAADKGDMVLKALRRELLEEFCLLLNNVCNLYDATYISLHGFGFTTSQLMQIRHCAADFLGRVTANNIDLCSVEEEELYSCGSTYAVIMGYFKTGGMFLSNENNCA